MTNKLPTLSAILFISTALTMLSGCSEDDPFEKLTSIDNVDTPVSKGSAAGDLLPDLSNEENLGNEQVGQNIKLEEITQDTGIDFTYRNGRDAGNNSDCNNSDCITQILRLVGGSSRVFEKGVVRVWSIVPESESESESRMAKVRIIGMTGFLVLGGLSRCHYQDF